MSTAEALHDRRELVLFFAGKKQTHGRHFPKKSSRPDAKPPKDGDGRFTRRKFLIGGAATLATGAAAYLTRALEPWEWLNYKSEETLESSVSQAKKMEEEYRGMDLTDRDTRNRYTELLADIYAKYYPTGISKQQLLSSIIWVNSKDDFERIFIEENQDPAFSKDFLKQLADKTTAITTRSGKMFGKTFVSSDNYVFQKKLTGFDAGFPRDWNPLKSLRITLMHEFGHQTSISTDPLIFSIVDPDNNYSDKRIDGFQIRSLNKRKEIAVYYQTIDEAGVDLLSKYINTDLFQSFATNYISPGGDNVSAIVSRFGQILDTAGITRTELARLHQASELRGLLLLIAERGGIDPQKISDKDRILSGFFLFNALIENNQRVLQEYMNSARRLVK